MLGKSCFVTAEERLTPPPLESWPWFRSWVELAVVVFGVGALLDVAALLSVGAGVVLAGASVGDGAASAGGSVVVGGVGVPGCVAVSVEAGGAEVELPVVGAGAGGGVVVSANTECKGLRTNRTMNTIDATLELPRRNGPRWCEDIWNV